MISIHFYSLLGLEIIDSENNKNQGPNPRGPENSFFYDKTLFNHQNRRVGMENHPTGNAGIKQACKDVPLVI